MNKRVIDRVRLNLGLGSEITDDDIRKIDGSLSCEYAKLQVALEDFKQTIKKLISR